MVSLSKKILNYIKIKVKNARNINKCKYLEKETNERQAIKKQIQK